MIPAAFDYAAPGTLEEAFALLEEYGDEAKILAGGHSLIPMMKLRFAEPGRLIDINNIPGLSYIKEEDGYLKIGAMTRESDLERSDLIPGKYQIFLDASKLIADPQVRNMGTIGAILHMEMRQMTILQLCWQCGQKWSSAVRKDRGLCRSMSFSMAST